MKQRRSFWKIVMAIGLFFFSYATVSKWFQLKAVYEKKRLFEKKIVSLEEKKDRLQKAFAGQDDPVWLELVMMEELGVIPEGAIKINYLEEE